MPNTNPGPEANKPLFNPGEEKDFDRRAKYNELNDLLGKIETWESAMHDSKNAQDWQESLNTSIAAINDDIANNRDEAYGKIEELIKTVTPLSKWVRDKGLEMYNTRTAMDIDRGYDGSVNTFTVTLPYFRYRCGLGVDTSALRGCTYKLVENTKFGPRYVITVPKDTVVNVMAVNRDGKKQRVNLTTGNDMEINDLAGINSMDQTPVETVAAPDPVETKTVAPVETDEQVQERNMRKAYVKLAAIFDIPLVESNNLPNLAETIIGRLSDTEWYSTENTGLFLKDGQLWERDGTAFGTDEEVQLNASPVGGNFAEIIRKDPVEALKLLSNGDWEQKLEDPRIAGTRQKANMRNQEYHDERAFTPTEVTRMLKDVETNLASWRTAWETGKDGTAAYNAMNVEVKNLMRMPGAAERIQAIVDAVAPIVSADYKQETKFVFRPEKSDIYYVNQEHKPTPKGTTEIAGNQ